MLRYVVLLRAHCGAAPCPHLRRVSSAANLIQPVAVPIRYSTRVLPRPHDPLKKYPPGPPSAAKSWMPEHRDRWRGIPDGCKSTKIRVEASQMDARAPGSVSRHPRWMPEHRDLCRDGCQSTQDSCRGIPDGCQSTEFMSRHPKAVSAVKGPNDRHCRGGACVLWKKHKLGMACKQNSKISRLQSDGGAIPWANTNRRLRMGDFEACAIFVDRTSV